MLTRSACVPMLLALCALAACASKPPEPTPDTAPAAGPAGGKPSNTPAAKPQYTYMHVTGSNIPMKVTKAPGSALSAKPTMSIGAQEIELSGLDNTSDALKQLSPPLNH